MKQNNMIKRQGNGVGTLVIRQTKQGKVYQCKIRERGRYYCGTGKTQKEARDNARSHLEYSFDRVRRIDDFAYVCGELENRCDGIPVSCPGLHGVGILL